MSTVERVKRICKARKIAISKLESACGFGNGYINKLQKGTFPQDRLLKISDYLGVPMEYLLGVKDEYGLIPDEWDQIGVLFGQFAAMNNKSASITARNTGIPVDKIGDFFNAGVPMSGVYLHQICMDWNVPLEKVIGGYAKAFETKKDPAAMGEVSDDDLKFALAGDVGRDLTDEDMAAIRAFAAWTAQERRKKK